MTQPDSTQPKKRLNLDMGPLDWKRLEELAEWSGQTNAETIRRIIRMHHHIAAELRDGARAVTRRRNW